MDLRPTIIIASLIGTLIVVVVVVVVVLYRILRSRHQRRAMGDQIEEAEVPVRKLIIRKGRVVPDYCKENGMADRARTWTDRLSWLPGDINRVHMEKKAQRLPPSAQLPWPISKYNSMRQHNPMKKHLEYSGRKSDTCNYPAAKGYSMRGNNNNAPDILGTRSLRVPKPTAASARNPRRSRAEARSASSIAHVGKLARSLERAYKGPSSQTSGEMALSPPAIVITQEPLTHPLSRSKGISVGTRKCDLRSMPSEVTRSSGDEGLPSKKSKSSTLQLPTEPSNEAGQPRRNLGQARADISPVSPSNTVATTIPPTSSQSQPSPVAPLPLFHPIASRMLQTQCVLARSQNTLRSKHPTRPGHRPGKLARIDTNVPRITHTSFLDSATPSAKDAADIRRGHSLMSSKSVATFTSSDISDTYTLGKAMPVPILPASKTVSDWIAWRNKALPMLPVTRDLNPEENVAERGGMSKGERENWDPRRDPKPVTTGNRRPAVAGMESKSLLARQGRGDESYKGQRYIGHLSTSHQSDCI